MLKALYFKTLYSFLDGDVQSTKLYFDFLREESKIRDLKACLDNRQLRKLKEIRESLLSGKILSKSFIEQEPNVQTIDNDPAIKQPEVVRKIHEEGFGALKNITKNDGLSLYNIEHPCAEYGRVDMVYMGGDVCYPLEVKIREGRHDLIGQIDKYIKHFTYQLHYCFYKDVQGITICRSYESHVLEELKKMNVLALVYYFSNSILSLRKV